MNNIFNIKDKLNFTQMTVLTSHVLYLTCIVFCIVDFIMENPVYLLVLDMLLFCRLNGIATDQKTSYKSISTSMLLLIFNKCNIYSLFCSLLFPDK